MRGRNRHWVILASVLILAGLTVFHWKVKELGFPILPDVEFPTEPGAPKPARRAVSVLAPSPIDQSPLVLEGLAQAAREFN